MPTLLPYLYQCIAYPYSAPASVPTRLQISAMLDPWPDLSASHEPVASATITARTRARNSRKLLSFKTCADYSPPSARCHRRGQRMVFPYHVEPPSTSQGRQQPTRGRTQNLLGSPGKSGVGLIYKVSCPDTGYGSAKKHYRHPLARYTDKVRIRASHCEEIGNRVEAAMTGCACTDSLRLRS